MKMVLDIKDKRALKPIKNDVIIFDGKEWYLTTKDEILKETYDLLKKCNEGLENIKKENKDFKTKVASQMLEISKIVTEIYSKENN